MKAITLWQPWASLCPELAERTEVVGECWVWRGTCSKRGGYGLVHLPGRLVKAHRLSYERAHGPVPDGLHVLHSCDNPPCVNPAHLHVDTHAENMREKAERRRAPSLAGSRNGRAVLSPSDVAAIRRSHDSVAGLARRFGVSRRTIRRARDGETWRSE